MMIQNIESLAGPATKYDYEASIAAGVLIGLFSLPILSTAVPNLFGTVWPLSIIFFLVAPPIGIFIASKLSRVFPFIWQFAKFVLIGGLNALVDIGVLAAIQSLFQSSYGIGPDTAIIVVGSVAVSFYVVYKAISFLVANFNSFFWNKYWIFADKTTKGSREEFIQFLIVSIVGFLINIFFTAFIFTAVTPLGGMNHQQWGLLCAAFGGIAGMTWNFVGYKLFVFKK